MSEELKAIYEVLGHKDGHTALFKLRITQVNCSDCGYHVHVQLPTRQPDTELVEAIKLTLKENAHLADGEDCTLRVLRDAYLKYKEKK